MSQRYTLWDYLWRDADTGSRFIVGWTLSIMFLMTVALVVGLIVESASTFEKRCDKASGLIAEHHFGKHTERFCIKGKRVLFDE